MGKAVLATRRLDPLWSRLGLFRGGIRDFAQDDAVRAAPDAGPIERAYFAHQGNVVHKWHHYLPLYDRYFERFRSREKPLRMLEIGVADGGSLELWRSYFGKTATIFGIDINPACARFDGIGGNQVRIGSQADPAFLRRVVAEMGGLDLVLDDGSHVMSHMGVSFDTLFPVLSDDGLYAAEDLHTSYWKNFEGGYFSKGSFISLCKQLIDDMHHWYHPNGQRQSAAQGSVAGLHIHDSIAFIEKRRVTRPVHSFKGSAVTPNPIDAERVK